MDLKFPWNLLDRESCLLTHLVITTNLSDCFEHLCNSVLEQKTTVLSLARAQTILEILTLSGELLITADSPISVFVECRHKHKQPSVHLLSFPLQFQLKIVSHFLSQVGMHSFVLLAFQPRGSMVCKMHMSACTCLSLCVLILTLISVSQRVALRVAWHKFGFTSTFTTPYVYS